MKRMSENTPGGRIRSARLDSHLTLQELATAISMTPGHLGLVERGNKKPTDILLERVAKATNVSLSWLRDGVESDTSNISPVSEKESENVDFSMLDARLFLGLLMIEDPDTTKNNLAYMLRTDENTIDAVLSGKNTEAARSWASGFSFLARRLDMSVVARKLKILAAYLEHEEQAVMHEQMEPLVKSLRAFTMEKGVQNLGLIDSFGGRRERDPYYTIIFQGDGNWVWDFRYFRTADIEMDNLAKTTIRNLPQRASLCIVFDDKGAYQAFLRRPITEADMRGCQTDISAILVDGETYAVAEEESCWPVAGDNSAE